MQALNPKAPLTTLLGFFWILLTIFLFLGLSVLVFVTPRFPLAMGVIRTTGRSGLWVTLLPTLVGAAGRSLEERGTGSLACRGLFVILVADNIKRFTECVECQTVFLY